MSHSRMIYDHFQARSAKTFMGFYGSLMDIYDQKNREAQKTFQGHFLSH